MLPEENLLERFGGKYKFEISILGGFLIIAVIGVIFFLKMGSGEKILQFGGSGRGGEQTRELEEKMKILKQLTKNSSPAGASLSEKRRIVNEVAAQTMSSEEVDGGSSPSSNEEKLKILEQVMKR